MKKIIKFLFVVAVVCAIIYFPLSYIRDKNKEASRIDRIKDGAYLEVIYEDTSECKRITLSNGKGNGDCVKTELQVRKDPRADAESLGTAQKGEIYEIVTVEETDPLFIWFKVIYQKNYKDKYQEGYIAQPRSLQVDYVKVYGIETDYAVPQISFTEDEYEVDSIDDITYDHLTLWDDQPGYTVTHQVYIERNPIDKPAPQYWIKYTITDKKGKSSSKSQRIIFKYPPSDNAVKDFSLMR